jgi:hypothetical protein
MWNNKGGFLWLIWNEKNKIIFQQTNCRSIRSLDSSIITLARYWCQLKGKQYLENMHIILSYDISLLPVQITEQNLSILPLEEVVLFGGENNMIVMTSD